MMNQVWVDDRYRGAHGIGRYTREVLSRLSVPVKPLSLSGTPYSPFDSVRAVRNVAATDVVYSPGYGALLRVPRQILTIHDLIQLRSPWPGRAKFVAYYAGPVRHAVRKAGVVFTVSETSARDIREWIRDDSVKIVNAGNGCSDAFQPDGPIALASDPYLMYVGNMRHHKNLDVVLRAMPRTPDLRLRAVIPAAEHPSATARANALGVSNRIEWISDVDDERLAELYRGAVATVMPSTDEGFGLPALESVACGTPVIYWQGCASVAEIVGDRGWSLPDAHVAAEWADVFTEAVNTGRRVVLPRDAYDWNRTASIISGELEKALTS